jgi:hypothetical protein
VRLEELLSQYLNDAPIHGPTHRCTSSLLPMDIGCVTPALRSRRGTATPAARDANLDSGNHAMPRLSALAYLADAPIYGLADVRLAYCQRITDIGWCPGPRTQNRHTTPQLWPHKRPRGHQTTYMHLLSMTVGLRTSTWPLLPFVQPEIAPALTSECVRWRGCKMHNWATERPHRR